jgi:MFS family permease
VSAPQTGAAPAHRVVAGLMPAIFLGAIDGSMLPAALLTIGRALGDASLIAWVMTGYLVAATVATPVYGKLSDLYGRRPMLIAALAMAVFGSVLSAAAQSMPMLIGARVLQGLGSGVLFALAQAAMADVVSGPERGRYQGWFSSVFATAALAAPLAGGLLTEHVTWRAVFLLNLPLALLALWSVRRVVPHRARGHGDAAAIDWVGAGLLAAGLGIALVAISRVGHGAGWLDRDTLALAALGVLLLAGWVGRESGAREPIVPLSLFGNRVVLAGCLATLSNFFVLLGCTVLLPLSMQALGGYRPDEVAARLIALTLSVPAGAFCGGRIMLRTPQVGRLTAAGLMLATLALAATVALPPGTTALQTALMVPLGIGLGLTLPATIVGVQMAVGPSMVGVATSLVAFFRSLGGVLGVAVLTSLVLGAGDRLTGTDPAALQRAFDAAFTCAAAVALLGSAVALRLGPVRTGARAGSGAVRS